MEAIVAKSAGFCFGVKRAVNTVYEEIEKKNGPIYTLGPIIHNEEVVNDLSSKGVSVIEEEADLEKLSSGTVIIRSHGVSKHIYDILEKKGLNYVDATCPFVKKIHNIVHEESEKGKTIIIIGDPTHPEVIGIKGWCTHNDIFIVANESEARSISLPGEKNVAIVSQTTFNSNKFKELVEIISEKSYDIIVLNTICNATEERQREAADIASKVDLMIVIGGRSSSNTQKLYEICKSQCENTYYIQTVTDLKDNHFENVDSVGITAGASTPRNIIEEVQTYVRNEF